MSSAAEKLMSVDEFVVWAEAQEGRWELHEGRRVSMSPERILHVETKFEVVTALRRAIERAAVPCRAVPDGAAVRIAARTAFEPDATVYCGPRLPPKAIEIPDPIIVVEVLSPSTAAVDHGAKLRGYFSLPSVMHYLILDADTRTLTHHRRGQGDIIETRMLGEGMLRLDPPGIETPVGDMFPPP